MWAKLQRIIYRGEIPTSCRYSAKKKNRNNIAFSSNNNNNRNNRHGIGDWKALKKKRFLN